MGGKRYLYILCALFGYFALVAHRIPARKVNLYVNLYFHGLNFPAARQRQLISTHQPRVLLSSSFSRRIWAAMSSASSMDTNIARSGGLAVSSAPRSCP